MFVVGCWMFNFGTSVNLPLTDAEERGELQRFQFPTPPKQQLRVHPLYSAANKEAVRRYGRPRSYLPPVLKPWVFPPICVIVHRTRGLVRRIRRKIVADRS